MDASKIEASAADAVAAAKRRRRDVAAAAERSSQVMIRQGERNRFAVVVAMGLTCALAGALGVLQLRDFGLQTPILWVAAIGVVILVVTLILLYVEFRNQAARLGLLVEAQRRQAYAVESASLGVLDWDVETGRVHCDESWFVLLGAERRERSVSTGELAAAVHPDDRRALRAAAGKALRGRAQAYDIEHRVKTARGEFIWVRSRGKVIERRSDGKARRIISVVADISERVALANAQRESRELMLSQEADLLQCFHSGVLHWGQARMVLPQIVEVAAKALGADRVGLWYYSESGESIVCADSYEASSECHRSGMERDVASLPAGLGRFESGGATEEPQQDAGTGGDAFFVDDIVSTLSGVMCLPILRSGRRIGVLEIERAGSAAGWAAEERLYGMMIGNLIMLLLERDAHREAQNTLLLREQQLRLITDSVPALIAYVNAEERLEFHNRAYHTRFGETEQSAIGRPLREILGEPLYRRTRKHLLRALGGTEASFRTTYRARDGVRRTDLIRLVPHLGEGGEVRGCYALLIDVTDQMQSEEKLRLALTRAEDAARGRDAFLATVTHELRTPLNAIIGFNSLMLEKECQPEERRRYLHFARDAGKALLAQVNDLLDMAKIEAGKIEPELLDFDLRLLIESSVDMVRSQAQARGLEVNAKISGTLCRWVRGDPTRLRQILFNLLSNAVKFTEHGSIQVSAQPAGEGMVEIAVADTGVGIPPEKLGVIFEKFNQADVSVTRRFGGTGLGLAICRSLARLMEGEISVESTLGRGSVFRLTLPLQTGTAPVVDAAPLRGMRTGLILVVEDQEANAVLAKALLEDMGQAVEVVGNGAEALERLAQRRFDVVLMDLEMPVMGGLEAARRIRAMDAAAAKIPLIAMSASAGTSDIARCKAAGMDEHVAKPISRDAIVRALDRWIPERRTRPRTKNPAPADSCINKLVGMVGQSAAMEVAKVFESALVKRIELFRAKSLDLPAIKIEVHNLAGISTTLGFDELAAIARKVDDRLRDGQPIEDLMPNLLASCEAAEAVLLTLFGNRAAS